MQVQICVRVVENLSRVQIGIQIFVTCISSIFQYQGQKCVIFFSLHVASFLFLKQQHHDYSFPTADLCLGECLSAKLLSGKTRTLNQESLASQSLQKQGRKHVYPSRFLAAFENCDRLHLGTYKLLISSARNSPDL